MRQGHSQTTNSEDRPKRYAYQVGCEVNVQKISQHKLMPGNDTLKTASKGSPDN
jgi:hypothetical protein